MSEIKYSAKQALLDIEPFLKRLIYQRLIYPCLDEYENNEYINRSTDCKNALKAIQRWREQEISTIGKKVDMAAFENMALELLGYKS